MKRKLERHIVTLSQWQSIQEQTFNQVNLANQVLAINPITTIDTNDPSTTLVQLSPKDAQVVFRYLNTVKHRGTHLQEPVLTNYIQEMPPELYPQLCQTLNKTEVASLMSTCRFFSTHKTLDTIRDAKPTEMFISSGYSSHYFISFPNVATFGLGSNSFGELGLGDTKERISYTPIPIPGLGKGVTLKAIAAGDGFTIVLLSDGSMHACGKNDCGQLGLGDKYTRRKYTPVTIDGLGNGTKVIKVLAIFNLSFALLSDGTLYGCGDFSDLGEGRYSKFTLLTIPGLSDGVKICDIFVSEHQLLLQLSDDSLCTMEIDDGILVLSTLNIPGLGKDVRLQKIAFGNGHTLALLSDGSVYGCGSNEKGQLGLGDDEEIYDVKQFTPISITGLDVGTSVLKVVAAQNNTYAFLSDGRLYGCGFNQNGKLEPNISNTSLDVFTCLHTLMELSRQKWRENESRPTNYRMNF